MTVSGPSAMTYRRPSLDLLDSSDDEAILFDDIDDSDEDLADRYGAPIHPIGAMQGPFTESIADSKDHSESGRNPLQFSNLTPEDRRGRLLQGIDYNDTYSALWRANPHNKYHPLAKIFAQIAFGVHLLHQTAARSNDEVITILQRHIDDVDEFVRRADEDLDMALVDIGERINHLKIPLEHISTFETMLEDRPYRMSILEGNENIERIVSRTASLMDDLVADTKCGITSIQQMSEYFTTIGKTWPSATVSFGLYNRMLANTEGWFDCFEGLKLKGNSLGAALVQLSSFLNEIAKRAGIASRRQAVSSQSTASLTRTTSSPTHSKSSSQDHRGASPTSTSKPLPQDPDSLTRAIQETMPKSRSRQAPRPKREKPSDGQSTTPKKSTDISDRRASTATIASLFVSSSGETKQPKSGKTQKSKKQRRMQMPKLPRRRKASITEKFPFSLMPKTPSIRANMTSPTNSTDVRSPHRHSPHSSAEQNQRPTPTPPLVVSPSPEPVAPSQPSTSPPLTTKPFSESKELRRKPCPVDSSASATSSDVKSTHPSTSSHQPNASKSSNSDSLVLASPASTRPTSPASQLSVKARVDSPTTQTQAINLSRTPKERPKVVEVTRKNSTLDSSKASRARESSLSRAVNSDVNAARTSSPSPPPQSLESTQGTATNPRIEVSRLAEISEGESSEGTATTPRIEVSPLTEIFEVAPSPQEPSSTLEPPAAEPAHVSQRDSLLPALSNMLPVMPENLSLGDFTNAAEIQVEHSTTEEGSSVVTVKIISNPNSRVQSPMQSPALFGDFFSKVRTMDAPKSPLTTSFPLPDNAAAPTPAAKTEAPEAPNAPEELAKKVSLADKPLPPIKGRESPSSEGPEDTASTAIEAGHPDAEASEPSNPSTDPPELNSSTQKPAATPASLAPPVSETYSNASFAASTSDLPRPEEASIRPNTSRSFRPTPSRSKLGLFPTASPSFVSLRAAQSEVTLPLKDMHAEEEGIGEEADSALPRPVTRKSASSGGSGMGGIGGMGVFKKLMAFGRRGHRMANSLGTER